jgi:hypothetical protein
MTKPIILALLASCGTITHSQAAPEQSSPDEQPDVPEDLPVSPPPEEQHFCCKSVDLKEKSGEDCIKIDDDYIDQCGELLFCSGDWGKSKGITKCL